MRAIRIHGFGGIDTMRLDEIPRPVPGAGEVLVAVKAAGVGPWDRLMREGRISQRLLRADRTGTSDPGARRGRPRRRLRDADGEGSWRQRLWDRARPGSRTRAGAGCRARRGRRPR